MGRDLSRSAPGQLEKFVQGQGELSFQYLHQWRLPHLSGQPGPAFERPGSKKVFSCVRIEFHVFLFVPVASCPVTVPVPCRSHSTVTFQATDGSKNPNPMCFPLFQSYFCLPSLSVNQKPVRHMCPVNCNNPLQTPPVFPLKSLPDFKKEGLMAVVWN